ncbi:hypothetical protein [Phocaeicola coprocola]|uniref:hypothetical protein n=1 Tax=Phocaeicola coprocola TaxID=310298 RepID=UPI002FE2C381
MKKILIMKNWIMLVLVALLTLNITSCSDEEDGRIFEEARIVGVKIDNELFNPSSITGDKTIVDVPAGRNLSNVKLHVLVANGELQDFNNGADYDCRKPIALFINGYDGNLYQTKLHIKSAPKLTSFIIKGMTIPATDIHESSSKIIVQVPEGTDLTNLQVTMEFANGTLKDFQNGVEKDYTNPCKFSLLGVDEETEYAYELIITTEPVGPASISAITVNGVQSDSILVENNKVVPYIPALMDFTSVDVELKVGFGNVIDESFTGKGLNLMTGNNKVKVTGTNGIETEFVIGVPQLSMKPLFAKSYGDLGFKNDDLCAVGFSGNYLLATNYTSTAKTPIYFNFDGTNAGQVSADGVNPTGYGFRKFATDEQGKILALSLGMSAGEQWIYKWDDVQGKGVEYISFSKASLGVDYNPRAAGISVNGSLDGNATIIVTIAQSTDVFIWTVTGGNLNKTPKKYSFPYSGVSYYWTVCAMPASQKGYLGFVTNATMDKSGVVCMSDMMSETQRISGFSVTDGKTISYKGRDYLAFVSHNNSKGTMWICDITGGQKEAYENPIFKKNMEVTGANGNLTTDADFTIIDGKLYVAFACTNLGLYLYEIK